MDLEKGLHQGEADPGADHSARNIRDQRIRGSAKRHAYGRYCDKPTIRSPCETLGLRAHRAFRSCWLRIYCKTVRSKRCAQRRKGSALVLPHPKQRHYRFVVTQADQNRCVGRVSLGIRCSERWRRKSSALYLLSRTAAHAQTGVRQVN